MLSIGNSLNSAGKITAIGNDWVLNADTTHVLGTYYVWDDLETFDDTKIWKD